MRVTGTGDFFFSPFFVGRVVEGEGMSKMMSQWFQKAKPGDKGLTRPPSSSRVSAHKNDDTDVVVDDETYETHYGTQSCKPHWDKKESV